MIVRCIVWTAYTPSRLVFANSRKNLQDLHRYLNINFISICVRIVIEIIAKWKKVHIFA